MIKKLIKFLIFIIAVTTIAIAYLSLFGIKTTKFNDKIKSEVLNINNKVNVELKEVKLLLNPSDLSINIKTLNPEIFINNKKLELKYIKTNLSLESLINKELTLEDLEISTKAIRLKDVILFVRSFKNSAELFILDNVIKEGFIIGNIKLNFDKNGKIKSDYEIKGFIKKAKLGILKKYTIDNLDFNFNIKNKEYHLENIEGAFNQAKLFSTSLKVKKKNDKFLVKGNFISKKNDITIKILNNLFENNLKDQGVESISFSSNNSFVFDLDNKFKIRNLDLKSEINLESLHYKKDLLTIKKFLPDFKNIFKLENHKISANYKNNKLNIIGKGQLSIDNKTDKMNYRVDVKNNDYNFNSIIKINKNFISLDFIDYKKKNDLNSILEIKGSYKKNKKIKFESISLKDDSKNSFIIKGLSLDRKFKILHIDNLNVKFINNNMIWNQFSLKKNKRNYKIYGDSLDATTLIDGLLNDENENNDESFSLFNNLNSDFNIMIEKTFFDKDTYVNNLNGNIFFQNNKINTLNLNSTFPNKKKLTLTISTNKDNGKITTLFSGHPKSFVKRYKFIKGFQEGVLDFYSIKKDGISNSVLNIDNFKIQEVPVLAKLLTLASLQGIADLLTGEGIRFTNLEMKFSNEKKLMKIEEMYAIGPAISILMDGYIESNKLISLRGTLVPATTINRSIASIPLIGKILVGKKTGEGVFGVSFKIKGPPNNIKTSVNPLKTLTPRFITRTLEKIKKN